MKCKAYSEYSSTTFECEAGHEQKKIAIYTRKEDGAEFIFNCSSKCEGGAEYSMGKCVGCDEKFTKVATENSYGSLKPLNYIKLYSHEDVMPDSSASSSKEEKPDNSTDPVCPVCNERNAHCFITDLEGIRAHAFSPSKVPEQGFSESDTAELGICSDATCIKAHGSHPFGVALITRAQWANDDIGYDTRGKISHVGEPCQMCDTGSYRLNNKDIEECLECGHTIGLQFAKSEKPNHTSDASYAFRKMYSDALKDRRWIVDPPYYYTSAENPFSRAASLDSDGVPDKEMRATTSKHSDEWFNCLETYLSALKNANGFRHEQLIAAAYIDKTFNRRHIEPLWLYASGRQGVGNSVHRAFEIALENMPVFEQTIRQASNRSTIIDHVLEPSQHSVQLVYGQIKALFGNLWPFSNNQTPKQDEEKVDEGLIEVALEGLQRLQRWTHYQKFWTVPMHTAPYDLNGSMTAAPGLVECICVLWSIGRKNQVVYRQVREKVFPDGNAYWRKMLSPEAITMVERLEAVVFKQMNKL